MKRLFTYAGVAALALFAVVAGVWIYIGRTGGSGLEQCIGGQIVGVLESHITPQVAFKSLDYQAPKTVVIDELTLTSEGQPILAVKRALLELAEIPREGQPILIQRIELDGPNLQFLTDAHGDFVGWGHFVKQEVIEQPESVPPGRRFSDILVLRHVAIRNGQVLYNDTAGGQEPMTLPGIEMNLDTPPDAAAPERAGPPAGGPAPAPARMALPAFDVPNPAGPGAENPPGSGQGTGGGTPPPGGRGAQAPPRVGTLPNPAETPFPGVGTQASPGRPDAPATPPPGGTPTVDPARPAPTPGAPPPLAVPANVPAGRGGGVVGTGGAGAPTPSVEPETPHGQIATVLTPLRRRADGTYRLTLRIQPPELGRVDLEVRLQGGRVNVRMLAELEETGSLLRASLGELRADLSDAGFRPGDLDLGRWGERARDAGDGLDSGGRPARDAEGDRLPGSPTRSRTDAHRLGEGALASRPDSVVDLQL